MNLKLIFISTLISFSHLSFSQKVFNIYSQKTLTLDKSVKIRNGEGYYILGSEKRASGTIKLFKDKFEVNFGLGDPDFSAFINNVKNEETKTIYICSRGTEKIELFVFEGNIIGDKKSIKIQLQTNFDNTLNLWSEVYVFQTYVDLSKEEREVLYEIRKKEIAEKQREDLIKDSIASTKYPKTIKVEVLEAFFVRKTKKGLILCWINEDKTVSNFLAAYNSLKNGNLRYYPIDKVKVSESIKQEFKNIFSEKMDGEYYVSISISHPREEIRKNQFIEKYEDDVFIAIREFERIKGYKSDAITWSYEALERYD